MQTSPLISAAELHEILGAVTLLDVRFKVGGPAGPDEFEKAHLPGAVYVDLDAALAARPRPGGAGGRHPLPDPEDFVRAMRAAGVSNNRPVIVYDDWAARAAARTWWLLRHHGHDDVRVLDGGLEAWRRAGFALGAGPSTAVEGDFRGVSVRLPTIGADDVPDFAGALIDARAPERFRGDIEPLDPVAGHIPGATNVPTHANLNEDGTFRSPAELGELYPEGRIACYCGSGVTAAHDLLALAVAGREGVLYPGSWSDWVSDPGRPAALGD